jgi:hypothetical protein
VSVSSGYPGVASGAVPFWWTEADDAELSVLVDAFVRCVRVHRARCSICSTGGAWCAPVREAFEGVHDWRDARALRSKAAWLRVRQQAREKLSEHDAA